MQRSRFVVMALLVAGCGGRGESEERARRPADARVAVDAATPRDAAADGPIAIPAPAGPWRDADCAATHAPRPDRDPSPMCFAPGGTVETGEPAQVVTLSPFFIDEHEVTIAQFVRFLVSPEGRTIGCEVTMPRACPRQTSALGVPFDVDTPPEGRATSATATFRIPPGMDRHPAHHMSFQGALAYCTWAGKTLPTEGQWLYAASVDPATGRSRRFPWGDRFEARRGNCDERACKDGFAESSPVRSFDGTGRRKDGRSPVGIHDAFGNVDEWTSTCVTEGPDPDCGECRDPAPTSSCALGRGVFRVFRGGEDFDFLNEDGPLSVWNRGTTDSDRGHVALGFRCVTAAAPAPGDGAAARPGSSPPW